MTVAVCFKCGAFKHGAFSSCQKCGAKPNGYDELTRSVVMSDHYFDKPALERIGAELGAGRPAPIDPAVFQDYRNMLASPAGKIMMAMAVQQTSGAASTTPPRQYEPSSRREPSSLTPKSESRVPLIMAIGILIIMTILAGVALVTRFRSEMAEPPKTKTSKRSFTVAHQPSNTQSSTGTAIPQSGDSQTTESTNSILANPNPSRLTWIKSGTFTMGSPTNEMNSNSRERPQTVVTLTRGFYMSKYETTQQEYTDVMGSNPSRFTEDLKRPVEMVSWIDATNYCGKLTEREKTAGSLLAGYEYRLPTEAEWEYACRAGTTTATAYGNSLSSSQANFNGNYPYNEAANGPYIDRTIPVGSYAPNAWGLYDMHGNLWEWCLDWYGTYPGGSVTDPKGSALGSDRVSRGGCWLLPGGGCRSAFRFVLWPDFKGINVGFRVVLAPTQ